MKIQHNTKAYCTEGTIYRLLSLMVQEQFDYLNHLI